MRNIDINMQLVESLKTIPGYDEDFIFAVSHHCKSKDAKKMMLSYIKNNPQEINYENVLLYSLAISKGIIMSTKN